MSWPTNPLNGQQVTINGITYQYNSSDSVWNRVGQESVTISNDSFTTDGLIIEGIAQFQQTQERFTTKTGATGVVAHDFSTGSTFYHTSIAGDFTANITNLTATTGVTTVIVLILVQGATPYICTTLQIAGTAQTIKWQGYVVPYGSANKVDAVVFTIFNNSGTYTVLGQLATFG